jgi:hypothetical protein
LILFFLLLPGLARAQEGEPLTARALETARRAELTALLRERGIAFEERPLFADYGGFGTSLLVRLPAPPAEETGGSSFILAVPLSKKADPGTLLPFGFEAALEFMAKMGEQGFNGEVGIAFLADEHRELPRKTGENLPLGLLDIYDNLDDPEHTNLLYLDLFEPPKKLLIHHGAAGTLSPRGLTSPFTAACEARAVPYGFAVSYNGLYRLGLAGEQEALSFALNRDMPALLLSADTSAAGPPLEAAAVAALLADYARSAAITDELPDTRYTLLYYGGKSFFLSETATVILLLLGAAFFNGIFMIYSLAYRPRFSLRRKLFFPYAALLLIHFGILYAALYGVELFFSLLLRALPVSPETPYYWGPVLLILTGTALYFVLTLPLKRIRKNIRRARLYGNGALVWFFLALLTGAALDITMVPIFIWALIMGIPGAFIRRPALAYLSALLVFPRIPGAFLALQGASSAALPALIRSGSPLLPLPVAVSLFPVLLLCMRGAALSRAQKKLPPRSRALIPRLCIFAAAAAALVWYGNSLSKIPGREQVRRTLIEGPEEGGILRGEIRDRVLAERRIMGITLTAPGNPTRFDLSLEAEEGEAPPLIYAASMPFTAGENSLQFTLGEGPPNPFSTEIALPQEFSGTLRAEAWYTRWEAGLDGEAPPPGADYLLRVVKTLPLSSAPAGGPTSGAP